MKNVIIIQPPLVQLNSPYPSGAYLSSFFRKMNCSVRWTDMSIMFFNRIFSREGLSHLFEKTEKKALELIKKHERQNDFATSENIRNYLLQKTMWAEWIERITGILKDGTDTSTRETMHEFIYSPFVPRGNRMMNYMENLDRELTIDDARNIASLAVEDLADYITFVADRNFSLIRYAESIVINESSFEEIEKTKDSFMMKEFYLPLLEKTFPSIGEDTLVCISVPFAGTFTPSLFTAEYFRKKFKDKCKISFGGGFVNTELREFKDISFHKYADYLSFDRGYGSYIELLEKKDGEEIYNMRIFHKDGITEPRKTGNEKTSSMEDELTKTLIPDYSDIDFSSYPRMADDTNPMHRLWSDGTWIKAYLAHGCYWHKCSFCDVTLDYVKSFKMTCTESLYKGLSAQCRKKNVYGIHFVDEALPPASLKKFAIQNILEKGKLTYWGNVRFEKSYTRSLTDILSKGGLIGVSGGIEIATGKCLDQISKGTDIDSIVSACCAFKESGILIHAYMIYGYFSETEEDIMNSMETLRQMFENGLIDSCFYHKFVLTRHSRLYDEWKRGMHKDLHPYETGNSIFAQNGLHFKGEEKYEKYAEGLNASLESWMHGRGIEKNIGKWFSFKTAAPTVPKNLVSKSIEKYEAGRNKIQDYGKLCFLPENMMHENGILTWSYMGETHTRRNTTKEQVELIKKMSLENIMMNGKTESCMNQETRKFLQELTGKGLVNL